MLAWTTQLISLAVCTLTTALPAQTHPDLGFVGDYPLGSEVWLGSIVGNVSVNPSFPVEVSVPGLIEWKIVSGGDVAKDQVIGLSDATKLALSSRELELKKSRYSNALMDLEWASFDKRRSLQNSIKDLVEKRSRMELTKGEMDILGQKFAQRLKDESAELQKELKRLELKLESRYFDQGAADDRIALDLEIERAEHDHRELLRSSEISAITAGKLVIESNEMMIRQDTPVARIIKQGQAEARLELADLRLRNLPGEQLAVEIIGEDGRNYRGSYSRILEQRSLDRDARIAIFEIQRQSPDDPIPENLSGARMMRIHRLLPAPGRIIPKKDLVFKFPKEISDRGWAAFIESRWPGTKVTFVGPKDLVVTLPDEN